MSDAWQSQIAQLSLDLMEARAAKADVIKRMREVSASLQQTRTQSRDQLEECHNQIQHLQEQLNVTTCGLTSAESQIDEMSAQIADYQTALRHRSQTEQSLRDFLRAKENELTLKDESCEHYSIALQREMSQLNEENRMTRASLMSEQNAGTKLRQELEAAQNQLIAVHSQLTKAKSENGILKANWQNERSRVMLLEGSQVASLVKDRDILKARLQHFETVAGSAESAKDIITKKDSQIQTLSKEAKALEAAIEVKDNMIVQLDTQLSRMQGQLKESIEHTQGQNKLIEDLYRRLEDNELPKYNQKAQERNPAPNDSINDNDTVLYEIWKDLEATMATITSVLGNHEPNLEFLSHDAAKDTNPTLKSIHNISSELRQLITNATASHIRDSCAMQ